MLTLSFLSLALELADKTVREGTRAEALALVEKAVRAQGGLEKLASPHATFHLINGSFGNGNDRFRGEVFSQGGGKLRVNLDFKGEGPRVLVLNGSKGWLKFNDTTEELDQQALNRMKKSGHVDKVCGLTSLLKKSKDYTFVLLGNKEVKKTPARAIRVSYPGMPDVDLYFDAANGLLIKTAYSLPESFGEKIFQREMYLQDYRLVEQGRKEEELLAKAKRGTDGPSLLAYFKNNTLTDADRSQIEALIGGLGKRSFRERERAMAGLRKWGIKAGSHLTRARKSPDAEVARRAEKCLQNLAENQELPLAAAAVVLVALRKPAGATRVLLDYLASAPDANTAREVLNTLAILNPDPKKADPALARAALDNPDPVRRNAAAGVLGKDGGAFLKQPGRRVIIDGLRLPHTVSLYRDGRPDSVFQTLYFDFFNRFDEKMFARP